MSFEEAWVRCCFCLATLYVFMWKLLYLYGTQVYLIMAKKER